MARKKASSDDLDNEPIVPNEDTELDESSIDEEEEETEDKGIDEILGGATLGRAGSDIDGWGGGEDYEG